MFLPALRTVKEAQEKALGGLDDMRMKPGDSLWVEMIVEKTTTDSPWITIFHEPEKPIIAHSASLFGHVHRNSAVITHRSWIIGERGLRDYV